MSNTQLQKKLDELILLATETLRINESSRQKLYGTLAQTYVTWRELQQDPLWLDAQYKKADITYRNTNEANFRPFIRLVFGVSETDNYYKNKIYHWQAVLRKLDEYYTADERRFRTHTANKLKALIDDLGGITSIVSDGLENKNESEDDSGDSKAEAKKKKAQTVSKIELSKRSISDFVNTETSIGAVKVNGAIRTDKNNLVALLARKEKNGSITVLGSTNNADAINEVAIGARTHNLSELAPSLMQLTECIATQMYPHGSMPKGKAAQKAWQQRIHYDRSDFKIEVKNEKTGKTERQTIPNPRRLMLRGKSGDVLFSSKHSDVSVVTKLEPNNFLIPKNMNAYLKTEERRNIEEWLSDNTIWLMNAEPENKLSKAHNQKYNYMLKITNTATSKHRNFHFYEQGRAQDSEVFATQTDFDYNSYVADWNIELYPQWFVNMRATFLDEWFRKLGNNTQLKRENNFKFVLGITSKKMYITYDIDASGIAPVREFDILSDVPARKQIDLEIRAKDIAPVLYNLANTNVSGFVYMSGNENALVIEYDTAVGHYTIAIPTLAERKLAQGKKTTAVLFKRTQ